MNYSDSMKFMTSYDLQQKNKRPFEKSESVVASERQSPNAQSPNASQLSFESINTNVLSIGLTEKQAKMCYALAKQTVVNETKNYSEYDKLVFVEFLELLGRIASIKYLGTDFEKEPLIRRIEYVLELILKLVNLERLEPISQEIDSSESDSDY